ncbi:glycosyltransferase [Kordiimonas aestuarii]|uniref:glycosyltransferase n=1 Tax=Kordiimonas aestuarii TaxID=1005925 RepID=UPI0021CFE8AC|nr:glycosyltransferase [Kordiimonas aestuarii]
MKVLHLTHGTGGGAGRATLRINQACQVAGLSSAVLNVANPAERDSVYQAKRCKILSAGECMDFHLSWKYIERQSQGKSNSLFSLPYPAVDLLSHPLVQAADIVNLHWVTWVLAPPHIRQLALEKPVVWTMHDYWAVTGGCHYPSGCEQFQTDCFSCPQVNDKLGVVSASFRDKRLNLSGIPSLHVTTPSRFLKESVETSRIFGDKNISHIENPIDLEVFSPLEDRDGTRASLGVEPDECVLVFGNYHNAEVRKGGDLLQRSLNLLFDRNELGSRKFTVITFGTGHNMPDSRHIKLMTLGSIQDDAMLRDILGIADVLCFPSLEDNYPNSIIEAGALGTPTIAYRSAGMQEMVVNGETGLLVDKVACATAFKDAIKYFHDHHFGDEAMRHKTRARASLMNAPAVVGQRYRSLYETIQQAFKTDGAATGGWTRFPPAGSLQDRCTKSLSAEMTPVMSDAFWGFPLNARLEKYLEWNGSKNPRLREKLWRQPELVHTEIDEAKKNKILLVATHHEHHAAHSGPLQYARHLPHDRFDWRYMRIPLGDYLAEEPERFEQVSAQLLAWNLPVLASQIGALMAELHIVQGVLSRPSFADIIHFIDGDHSGWLAPAALRALGAPLPRFFSTFHQPPATLASATAPALASRFDHICLMSHTQAQVFSHIRPAGSLTVTEHGVDTDFFYPATSQDAKGSKIRIRLLAVGHWLRDYETAFKAIDALIRQGHDIEYHIVGAQRGLQYPGFVTALHDLSDEELRTEYHQADAFFMPLQASTANNAILEAMACGLPIISTATGGMHEMVGDNAAVLCKPGVADDYSAAIISLLADPAIQKRLGDAARSRAEAFSWRATAKKMTALYDTALSAAPHPKAPTADILPWNTRLFDGHPYAALLDDINRCVIRKSELSTATRQTSAQLLLQDHCSLQAIEKYAVMLALSRLGSVLPCD